MANIGSILSRFSILKLGVMALLLAGVYAIWFAFKRFGLPGAAVVSLLPGAICVFWYTLQKPASAMMGLFVVNFFIMGMGRYMREVPIGTILDAAILYNVAILAIHAMMRRIDWKKAQTSLTLVALIWVIYCSLEAFNPHSVTAAWISGIRSFAIYMLLLVILTQIVLGEYKYLKQLLFIWAILTLIAVAKACVQKFIGFNDVEKYWLYVLGANRTHIIYSGTRYFSFFSDAANFGGSMGLSMVVFSISGLYYRKGWIKIFFFCVAAAACYGMLISGTRSALAVPFAGFGVFVLLSRNLKMVTLGVVALLGAFIFLNFTTIGQGNQIIRRARSAFNTDDASFQVRLDNQALLRELMEDKPFGTGLGLGGGKAKQYAPDAALSQIPTDSWFVMVWVETGVVGVLLHIGILLYILGWGSYQVLFRIRDQELKGLTTALICGIAGIMLMSYANEVLGQIPTGAMLYISMGFIFLSPHFDRQIAEAKAAAAQTHTA